jgi:hypothetical protein
MKLAAAAGGCLIPLSIPYYPVRNLSNCRGMPWPQQRLLPQGRVRIPAKVRNPVGLDSGDRVEFIEIGKSSSPLVPVCPLQSRCVNGRGSSRVGEQGPCRWKRWIGGWRKAPRGREDWSRYQHSGPLGYVTEDHAAQSAAVKVMYSLSYELPGFCPAWSPRNSFGCCSSPKSFKKHEIEHVVEKLLREQGTGCGTRGDPRPGIAQVSHQTRKFRRRPDFAMGPRGRMPVHSHFRQRCCCRWHEPFAS